MSTIRVIAAVPEATVLETGSKALERACAVCGDTCWIGESQQELMEALGEEAFLISCEPCLLLMADKSSRAEILASDEVMARLKKAKGQDG